MSRSNPEIGPHITADGRIIIPLPSGEQNLSTKQTGRRRLLKDGALFLAGVMVGVGAVGTAWMDSKTPEKPRVESSSNFQLFNQRDGIWALNNPHWYWRATCVPTVVAMLINNSEKNANVNPSIIDQEFALKKIRDNPTDPTMFRSGPNGSYDVLQWLSERGYEWKQIQDQTFPSNPDKKQLNFGEARKTLEEGYQLIGSAVVNWVETAPDGADHVFLIRSLNTSGDMVIADPWGGIFREVKLNRRFFKNDALNFVYAVRKKPG